MIKFLNSPILASLNLNPLMLVQTSHPRSLKLLTPKHSSIKWFLNHPTNACHHCLHGSPTKSMIIYLSAQSNANVELVYYNTIRLNWCFQIRYQAFIAVNQALPIISTHQTTGTTALNDKKKTTELSSSQTLIPALTVKFDTPFFMR